MVTTSGHCNAKCSAACEAYSPLAVTRIRPSHSASAFHTPPPLSITLPVRLNLECGGLTPLYRLKQRPAPNDKLLKSKYILSMNFDPLIRLRQTVGSTSRAAGSYKPR